MLEPEDTKECWETLTPGYYVTLAHMNPQQLWLFAQDQAS